jgi:hypothetical protein
MGIRVVPSEPAIPREAARHLEPDERRVITVRRHAVLPTLGILPLLLVLPDYMLHATGAVHGSGHATFILAVLIAPSGIFAVYCVVAWLVGYVVITQRRILVLGWWRVTRVTEILLSEATGLSFIRTVPGRMLGYGTFRVKRPGSRWRVLKIRFLPYPEQLYIEVCGLIFKDPDAEPYED